MRLSAAAFLALFVALPSFQAEAASDGETPSKAAHAAPHVQKTFLIPSGDGYGVGECLTGKNSECGQVVANAWCESQGFAAAGSYGIAAPEDYTGSIDKAPIVAVDERPVRITCQD